jgi:hypothetical protein
LRSEALVAAVSRLRFEVAGFGGSGEWCWDVSSDWRMAVRRDDIGASSSNFRPPLWEFGAGSFIAVFWVVVFWFCVLVCFGRMGKYRQTNKQTNEPTNKTNTQKNKQTNEPTKKTNKHTEKQTNKQSNKQKK